MSRRWLLIASAALCGFALLCTVFLLIYPRIGRWAVETKGIAKLEKRLGRDVAVDSIDVQLGSAVLRGVTIAGAEGEQPLLSIPEIEVDFGFWASLIGRANVNWIEIRGLDIDIARGRDERLLEFVRELRSRSSGSGGGGGGSGGSMKELRFRDVQVKLTDTDGTVVVAEAVRGKVLRAGPISATAGTLSVDSPVGPRASLTDVFFEAERSDPIATAKVTIGGGDAFLWKGFELSGVSGTVARAAGNGREGALAIDLSGGYRKATEKVWQAKGWVDPRQKLGRVTLSAERFSLGKIKHVLTDTPLREVEETTVAGQLSIEITEDEVDYSGNLEVSGLTVEHRRIALTPVKDIAFRVVAEGTVDRHTKTVQLLKSSFIAGEAEYQLAATLALPRGIDPETGVVRETPHLTAKVTVPPVECQSLLDSFPPDLVPKLQGFALEGIFKTNVSVDIDWSDLDNLTLDGSVGIFDCKVTKAPFEVSAARIMKPFKHTVLVNPKTGRTRTFLIGSGSGQYVGLAYVSKYLKNSLMASEDPSFFRHRGFIVHEFRTALIKNLKAGYFKFGASSITMQLVKNVFLSRQKTVSRKLQELFLTWYIETAVPKDRLLTVYLNAIEFGPNLFGIGPASWRYFGKPASQLNAVESAFFSSILPAPRRRYRQYCRDQLFSWTEVKIEAILRRLHKRRKLTDEELDIALATPLLFRPDKRGC